MDLSMLIIDNDHDLDRILESVNLDEYELISLAKEQLTRHMSIWATEWLPLWIREVHQGYTVLREFNGTAFGS